jgi:radical SAM protein with 4Fe4S-binding SPASM domain
MEGINASLLKAPVHAYLELTQACNLKCRHCYNDGRFNGNIPEEAPIEQIVDKIIEWDVFDVTLSGGEALLRRPQLYSALEKLSKAEIYSSLNTNLTLISKEDVEKLKSYRLRGLLTSLHSSNEQEHEAISGKEGCFKRTIQGIEKVVEHGIPVAINLVATKYTKNNIYNTGRLAKELGVKMFSVSPIVANPNKSSEHVSESLNAEELMNLLWDLYRIKRDFGIQTKLQRLVIPCFFWENEKLRYLAGTSCSADLFLANIRSDGKVTGCPTLNKSYGNLLQDPLQNIWENATRDFDKREAFEGCNCCDMKFQCKGGCKAENIALGIGPGEKHPLMKNPIKYEISSKKITLGTKISPNFKEARFREEKQGTYTLMTGTGDYYILTDTSFRIIKEFSQAPLLIADKELIENQSLTATILEMIEANILKIQGA